MNFYELAEEPEYAKPISRSEARLLRAHLCAPAFESFLYRFCIEKTLWYKLVWFKERYPSTEAEARYLSHYL